MLRTQKHRQIRRLGEPNPMDDVPDQDSAKIFEKKVNTIFCPPEQSGEMCVRYALCVVYPASQW